MYFEGVDTYCIRPGDDAFINRSSDTTEVQEAKSDVCLLLVAFDVMFCSKFARSNSCDRAELPR